MICGNCPIGSQCSHNGCPWLEAEVERLSIIDAGRCAKQPHEDPRDSQLLSCGEYTAMEQRAEAAEREMGRLHGVLMEIAQGPASYVDPNNLPWWMRIARRAVGMK